MATTAEATRTDNEHVREKDIPLSKVDEQIKEETRRAWIQTLRIEWIFAARTKAYPRPEGF
jgi:hypothetical protein